MLRPGAAGVRLLEAAMRTARASCLSAVLCVASCGREPARKPDAILTMPAFEVAAHSEATFCADLKAPLEADRDMVRLELDMTPGSHHFILFQVIGERPDRAWDCGQGGGLMPAIPVFAGQHPREAFDYPEGVGHRVRAGQQFAMQLHVVNASDEALQASAVVSMFAGSDGEVIHQDGIIGFSNDAIEIPPGAEMSFTRRCRVATGANVFSLSSHAHRRLVDFTARTLEGENVGPEVYRNDDWSNPSVVTYGDSPVQIAPGGGLEFTCRYKNLTERVVRSGSSAELDEMCIVFGHYYPGPGLLFCLDDEAQMPVCPAGPFDPADCTFGDAMCRDVACPEFNTCISKCGLSSGCFQCCEAAITDTCWTCVEPLADCAFKFGCIHNTGLSFDCLSENCAGQRRRCFGI